MPELTSFDYCVIRVVPRVEREEFLNAGVMLYCLSRGFLGARVHLDAERLRAFAGEQDVPLLQSHLEAIPRICAGGAEAGPIGKLAQKERWHWLVSPRSTLVQPGPVHSGLCESPELALEKLMAKMVLLDRR